MTHASQHIAVLTSAEGDGGGGAVRMNSVTRIANESFNSEEDRQQGRTSAPAPAPAPPQQPQAYNVVIPLNVRPGSTFPVSLNGEFIFCVCLEMFNILKTLFENAWNRTDTFNNEHILRKNNFSTMSQQC